MFEGLDMNALLAQAQQMQEEMMKAQQEQAAKTFEASAGGELVKLTLSGSGDLVDLQIAPEACDPEDVESLSALIVAAFRAAKQQADEAVQASAPSIPGMPGGLGL